MDARNQVLESRLRELGPDFYLKKPPLLIDYDTARLQRRAKNEKLFNRLKKLYEAAPGVTCAGCGNVCCSASPDFYLLEYLHVWRHIRYDLKDPALEAGIAARAMRWAFLSFIQEDIYCPFLENGQCLIYPVRPFNCRVWAVEDQDYYETKAARARAHVQKQEEFFKRHGVKLLRPMDEFILPKCRDIQIHGERMSEQDILAVDADIAFLHRTLIRPEEFRALNFHLHVPGHVALKRVPPLEFDATRVRIALERQEHGAEHELQQLIDSLEGRLP